MEIKDKVTNLIANIISDAGYELKEVNYTKEEDSYFLKIVIDKEEGINLDDCVKVTKLIDTIIDESDITDDSYILDVCSYERGE